MVSGSGSDGKESACNAGDLGSILGGEDPLEEGMAAYSSVLVWRIPWIEGPGGLQSTESPRLGYELERAPGVGDGQGSLGNGTPLQYSCLGNPMDGGAR